MENLGRMWRYIRGGSWGHGLGYARAVYRDGFDPDLRYSDVGFRVVKEDKVLMYIRGGSWFLNRGVARAVCRSFNGPDYRGSGLGFRVVRKGSIEYE